MCDEALVIRCTGGVWLVQGPDRRSEMAWWKFCKFGDGSAMGPWKSREVVRLGVGGWCAGAGGGGARVRRWWVCQQGQVVPFSMIAPEISGELPVRGSALRLYGRQPNS